MWNLERLSLSRWAKTPLIMQIIRNEDYHNEHLEGHCDVNDAFYSKARKEIDQNASDCTVFRGIFDKVADSPAFQMMLAVKQLEKDDWAAYRRGALYKISPGGFVMIMQLAKAGETWAGIRKKWNSGEQLTKKELNSIQHWLDGSEKGQKIWAGILEKWKSDKQLTEEEMDSIERQKDGQKAGGQAMKEKHDKEAGRTSNTPFVCLYYNMLPMGEEEYETGLQQGLPKIGNANGKSRCKGCQSRTGKAKYHRQWTVVKKDEEEMVKKKIVEERQVPPRIKRDLVMCEREGCINKPEAGYKVCYTHLGWRGSK